ncbi:hypothetical protein, partial [Actinacidiphila soli]|uniref:hypothetical protein n=1 Tax=Actinacidiphila soli TaxID=2487275 RepID=UPI0019D1688A
MADYGKGRAVLKPAMYMIGLVAGGILGVALSLIPSPHEPHVFWAEPVNVIKAGRSFYPCAGIDCSSGRGWSGLLIQAASGSLGGSGALRTKRSGC